MPWGVGSGWELGLAGALVGWRPSIGSPLLWPGDLGRGGGPEAGEAAGAGQGEAVPRLRQPARDIAGCGPGGRGGGAAGGGASPLRSREAPAPRPHADTRGAAGALETQAGLGGAGGGLDWGPERWGGGGTKVQVTRWRCSGSEGRWRLIEHIFYRRSTAGLVVGVLWCSRLMRAPYPVHHQLLGTGRPSARRAECT